MARYVATIAPSQGFDCMANLERPVDEMSLEPGPDGGSVVTYDGELRRKDPLHVFDVALGVIFRRLGDKASRGLRRALRSQEVV